MNEEAARNFHAELNSWPKAKAKAAGRPPQSHVQREEPNTPAQKLHNCIETADKHLAFLAKVVRTCRMDPDATSTVEQCTNTAKDLEELLGNMRGAEYEVRQNGEDISEEFAEWAEKGLLPIQAWVDKNKKICQVYLNAQVPEPLKKKFKKPN